MKRFISILSVIAMLCSFCAVGVLAADGDVVDDTIEIQVVSGPYKGETHTVNAEPIFVKDAECTENGVMRYECQEASCQGENHFHEVVLPATGHTWSTDSETAAYGRVAEIPTCTSTGSAYVYCTKCGAESGETRELATVDHVFDIKVVDEEATCLPGKYHMECACGLAETYTDGPNKGQIKYTEIPALTGEEAHSYTDWNVDEEPTCIKEGIRTRVCTRCGDAQYEVIEKLDHDYIIIDKTLDDDCATITVTWECSNPDCKDRKQTTVTGDFHKWELVPGSVTATCTEDGTATYVCAYNEEHTKEVPVKALGHDMGEWELSETYTKDGVEYGLYYSTCERCRFTQQTVMPIEAGEPEPPTEPTEPPQTIEENVYAAVDTITMDGQTASGTVTFAKIAGNQEDGKLYARIAYVMENEEGEQILYVSAPVIDSDMTADVYCKAPAGFTVARVCVVAVNERVTGGDWAGAAVSDPVVVNG